MTAFQIAGTVDRGDDLFGELAAFLKNLGDQLRIDVGEAGLVRIAVDIQDLIDDEGQVADGGFVGHEAQALALKGWRWNAG